MCVHERDPLGRISEAWCSVKRARDRLSLKCKIFKGGVGACGLATAVIQLVALPTGVSFRGLGRASGTCR